MPVRKIKKSWWVDFQIAGQRYRRRSPVNSRPGAVEYEAHLRQKIARGEPLDPQPEQKDEVPTFEEFAWKWFDIYVKNNNKPSEIRNRRYTLKTCLIPFFGKYRIDKIPAQAIEEYKAKKLSEGKLANKTINNHLAMLSKCLNTAQEWLDIEKVPKIKKLKVPPQKFDFLLEQDCELLLKNTQGILREMVLICLKTGVRFGELKGLRWEDIDWTNKTMNIRRSIYRNIVVSPKSNKERKIPLVDEVYELLLRRREKEGFIFLDKKGKTLKDSTCKYWLHQACKRAGLRMVGWHVFRHTFASHLAMGGASMRAIQELLGHSDLHTTMRYAHLAPSALREAITVLNRPFGDKSRQPGVNQGENFEKILASIASQNPSFLPKDKAKQDSRALS